MSEPSKTSEPSKLPALARFLLYFLLPRDGRAEVQDDLHELFVARRRDRGAVHAHWRLYRDAVSLRRKPRAVAASATDGQSAFGLFRDVSVDLKYAVRLFARQPVILLLAIVGLSIGLGIATAAFSIVNVAALRGNGLVDSNRVPGVLKTAGRSTSTVWTHEEFRHLREGSTRMQLEAVLSSAARVTTAPGEADGPSSVLAFVSGGFFSATGGRVIGGRPLEPGDEQSHSGPPPVVISFMLWTSKLNEDPGVVGRTIRVGRTDATIVGVAARGFSLPRNSLLWMPLSAHGAVYETSPSARTRSVSVDVFGKLLPGVSLSEAEAQLGGVAASLPRGAGAESPGVRLDTDTGLGRSSSSEAFTITVFVCTVIGLVLLLACSNVATLLVSTAITREREMAVRAALGASRRRIVRQLITESLALGSIAALIGLLFAYWAIPVIGTMIEAPPGVDLAPDLTVFLFLGIVTLLSGVGAGLAPARHGRGADLVSPLKGDVQQNRVSPRRLRSMLVMTQAAISVLLIVIATLFVRATLRSAAIDVGFDADGLYVVSPGFDGSAVDDGGAGLRSFWARATEELEAVPGIAGITLAEITPFGGISRTAATREEPARRVSFNGTHADYFETMGIRPLAGRTYTREEVAGRAPVAVVSQSLAQAYWHGQSPLGELLPEQIPLLASAARPVVIGVVPDVIAAELHARNAFAIYEPMPAMAEPWARLIVRVVPGAAGSIDLASQRLRAIDPQADITIESVAKRLQREESRPRMLATLTGVVGIIAIILCVIGLYGLTASVVGQRSREMAVRAAIGAERRDLLRLLMWDSLRPVVIGLAIGGAAALLISRLVAASVFFGVSPQDPIAFAAAAVILLGAAALAVVLPTRRAAAVDASLVLRRS